MAWMTTAKRWASEAVVVMSVKLGLTTPASLSSALAFSMSRFGIGTFLA